MLTPRRACFTSFISQKLVRRLNVLHLETRVSTAPAPRRYLAGLSLGQSSTALTCLLDQQVKFHQQSKKSSSPFDVLAVVVDTQGKGVAESRVDELRRRFDGVHFEVVRLGEVLGVETVDWSTLPGLDGALNPDERIARMFDALPSATARADVLRLLVRHLLLHIAMKKGYKALLLGHTTTALASLTLTEVANGRGFSVPWQTNDGKYQVSSYTSGEVASRTEYPIYFPLREIFRNEMKTYISLTEGLKDLTWLKDEEGSQTVVSHKDTSIAEVMGRYFESVEEPFQAIVSNVVRTTAKLDRAGGNNKANCGLCGIAMDEAGDERWAGEIGDHDREGGTLCYGCKRSVYG